MPAGVMTVSALRAVFHDLQAAHLAHDENGVVLSAAT